MAAHHCHRCKAIILSHNRLCPSCGHAVRARKVPVFWFMFMSALFVTYACLDFMHVL